MELSTTKISTLISKNAKFTVNNNLPENCACQVFFFEPETIKEKRLGQLAIVAQLTVASEQNQEILKAIFQEMQQSYYALAGADITIEQAFEKALQELNQRLKSFFVSQKTKVNWLNQLNLLIAVMSGEELHLTPVGQVSALMLWRERLIEIYQSEKQEINPLKIFSQILSGQLREEAVVVLSNNNLKDYLTEEKIKQSLSLPFAEISRHLKNLFWSINNLSLGAIIITRQKEELKELISHQTKKIFSPQKSMSQLLNTQAKTQSLLSTSLLTDSKKIYRQTKEFIRVKIFRKRQQPKTLETIYQAPKPTKESILSKMIYQLLITGKKILSFIAKSFSGIINLFRRFPKTKERIKGSPYEIEGSIVRMVNRFKKLPTISKVLFFIAIIFIFLFSGSIVIQGKIKDQQKATKDYQQLLTQIEEKENSVEANVAIKNYDKAKEFVRNLETDFKQLPRKSKEQKNKYSEIQNKLTILKNKVNRLTEVTTPTVLADLATRGSAAGEGLTSINNQLYAFDQQNQIYKISPEGSITLLDAKFETDIDLQTASNLDNYWLIYSNNKQIVELNSANESLQIKDITFPTDQVTVKALGTYQSRIYLLAPSNDQIYKSSRLNNSYSKGSPWRTDQSVNLEDAASLAIDGNIWVLKANGEIIKMLSGEQEPWSVEEFEPRLVAPTKIYTAANIQNLYILESQNQRLVVIDKEGKLINQYRSDKFNNLIDFSVQEAQKAVYLLNDKIIYKISL